MDTLHDVELAEWEAENSLTPENYRVFEPLESIAKTRNARSCDLLLARLFQVHPEYAAAALKGVEPRVVDSDEPIIKHVQIVVQQPDQQKVPVARISGRLKISFIVRAVANYYNVSPDELVSDRRIKSIVRPRHVTYYMAKLKTKRSLVFIGEKLGNRDHTTILSGCRKIEAALQTDARLRHDIECLSRILDEAV